MGRTHCPMADALVYSVGKPQRRFRSYRVPNVALKAKLPLYLCLINHRDMKTYGGLEE
jgi:hypothetical protein